MKLRSLRRTKNSQWAVVIAYDAFDKSTLTITGCESPRTARHLAGILVMDGEGNVGADIVQITAPDHAEAAKVVAMWEKGTLG